MNKNIACLCGTLICLISGACGQAGIRKPTRMPEADLPRPGSILVYHLSMSEQEVKSIPKVMCHQPAIKNSAERERLRNARIIYRDYDTARPIMR